MSNTWSDVIQSHIDDALDSLYTSMPGIVTAVKEVDGVTLINAQPALNRIDSSGAVDKEPTLGDVIVKWPSAGGCFMTMPIEIGDLVDLNFSMRRATAFKSTNGANPVTPTTKRRHDMNDVWATPAMATYVTGKKVDPDAVVIASPAVEIRILKDGTIELGKDAAEQLVLGNTFLDLYNTLSVPTGVGPSGNPIVPMDPMVHLSQVSKTL